ncbi:MAG: trypsin-like peptidase domain-containing protein, partial [Bacteroidota bacterium]
MKKTLSLSVVSILGGVITLSSYLYFVDTEQPDVKETIQAQTPAIIPTTFNTSTNTFSTIEAPDFISAAEKSVHAVVHVKNTAIVSATPSIQDFFYGRTPQPITQVGTGSGVIISPDGYIITNNHVSAGSDEISITLNDNRVFKAQLIGTDENTDIAL